MTRTIIENWERLGFDETCNTLVDTYHKSQGDIETLVENYINGQVDIEECMEILYML